MRVKDGAWVKDRTPRENTDGKLAKPVRCASRVRNSESGVWVRLSNMHHLYHALELHSEVDSAEARRCHTEDL